MKRTERSRLRLNGVDIYIPSHDGIDGECRHALQAQLLLDILAVGDDSRQPDVERFSYLLVYFPLSHE